MQNINICKTAKTTKENTEHTTINEDNMQDDQCNKMSISNEISPNKANSYRANSIKSYNNTSSKFQLFSEVVNTWETFARDDLLTFLEMEATPVMLFHLIQEMFHITHNLLKELIKETLCSVRRALNLPANEEMIKNIESRVKPLFKDNLDEIFCSKTQNEKFREKFDSKYTQFFINELNLKYCEDDKSLEFYTMLHDSGFDSCLSHVKHILLFCEFNAEQLYIDDIENEFTVRKVNVISLHEIKMQNVNNHISRRPYLILNETQHCNRVIPVISSPIIKKSKQVFNKDKLKTIVIPINEDQENHMKMFPLKNKDSIRMSTHVKNSFENEWTRSPEGISMFTLNGQIDNISAQYCDTDNNVNQHKCFNKKMSFKKIGIIPKANINGYSKMKRIVQLSKQSKQIQFMGIEHKNTKNINYLSAAKIANRNKCFLCRLTSNEGNSCRNRSKPDNNIPPKAKYSNENNSECKQQTQQRNRTRSSYQKGNAYDNSKAVTNVYVNKFKEDGLFLKTTQIPKVKRDNVIYKNNLSTSNEIGNNKRSGSNAKNNKGKSGGKGERSDNNNEESYSNSNNNNVSKDKNWFCYNKKGHSNKRQIITKLTKNKY